MQSRKTKRRHVVLMAVTLSLLTLVGPQTATAQFIPGVPVIPVRPHLSAPAVVRTEVKQSQSMPIMYTDIKVTSKMHTVAQPYELTSKVQYTLAANMLDTRVHVLNALGQGKSLEMVATLNNLGWMQEHIGLVASAQRSYLAALKLLNERRPSYTAEAAVIEYNLADMYMGEHHFLAAFQSYRAALQDLAASQNPDRDAMRCVQQKYNVVRKLVLSEFTD
jgi:hypothetical protein